MLTFIIPAYGESPYLEACVSSLLNQTLKCPIVIATSTPNKHIDSIAKKFDLTVYVNPNRKSIAADWNFCLDIPCSELIVLAHQDDIYFPEYAVSAAKFFNQNSECSIAFTDSKEIVKKTIISLPKRELVKKIIRMVAFLKSEIVQSKYQYFRLLAFGCPVPCSSVVFNTKYLQGLRFSNKYSVNLDWDLWCRVAEIGGKIGYIRGQHIAHRIHDGAETQAALKDNRRHKEDKEIFLRFWPKWMVALLHFFYRAGYAN